MTIANAKRNRSALDELKCTIEHNAIRYSDVAWTSLRYRFDPNISLYLDDLTSADDLVHARPLRDAMRLLGPNHGCDYSDYLKNYVYVPAHDIAITEDMFKEEGGLVMYTDEDAFDAATDTFVSFDTWLDGCKKKKTSVRIRSSLTPS